MLESVFSRIDHVVIETDDVDGLHAWFTRTLGLPEAWPVAVWGTTHEGGVMVGNCNLGINAPLDPNAPPGSAVRMLAFEPAGPLAGVIEECERRGLAPTDPWTTGPDDLSDETTEPWRRGWTSSVLGGLAGFGGLTFICDYHHDTAGRHERQEAAIADSGGGPLGVTGVAAVVLAGPDRPEVRRSWRRLVEPGPVLDAADASGSPLPLNAGPELWFEPAPSEAAAVVLAVRSEVSARAALDDLGIASAADGPLTRLDPAACNGLDLRLIER